MHGKCLIWVLWIFFVVIPTGRGSVDYLYRSNFEENKGITIPNECLEVLKKFAESASSFTMCAIQNARPIHICKSCVTNYKAFSDNYKAAMNHKVKSNESSTCKSMLLSKDKLEVVLTFHLNIRSMWEGANCDVCFDWGESGEPTVSNNTVHFYELFDATMDCLNNKTSNQSEQVCELCMKDYLELNEYYEGLSGNGKGLENICMDIIDSMNATRSIWSGSLNCCRLRKHPEIIFLCCTGIISSLPILFYVVLRYFGQMRDIPKALKQTRFKQTFLAALQHRRRSSS